METEKDRLAEKVEGLADIARERDGQLSTMQQQLQEAQVQCHCGCVHCTGIICGRS